MSSLIRSPLSKDKVNGADSNWKAESSDSHFPKMTKKGWTEKHCSLCKKHEGIHTTHNTKITISHKKAGGVPKPNNPASGMDGINFAQLIYAETIKAVCSALKKAGHCRKHSNHHKERDSNSDSDY